MGKLTSESMGEVGGMFTWSVTSPGMSIYFNMLIERKDISLGGSEKSCYELPRSMKYGIGAVLPFSR